jgi:fatty-acyl-CoA synthase
MAWVRARPDSGLTGDALSHYCKGRIATYKIPAYWRFVDAFPMTVTGKVQKFRMREVAIAELQLERAAAVATA